MAASQPAYFNLQEFTDFGVLAVGGRLYTYTYGTTTFKTAYADAAGLVPQTYTSDGLGGQYIALNARGELPAPLYLGSGSYDLTLKTVAGATVWTRRADGAALAADIVALAATSGSSLIGYIQSGVGAIARLIQDFLRIGWVNAEDFDTLQHAIDTGRNVRVNDPVSLAAPVTMSTDRQRLECGPTGVISPTYDGDVIRVTGARGTLRARVSGASQPGAGTLGGAIVIGYGGANARRCSIAGSYVTNFYGDAFVWEQGACLDATDAECDTISRDGFRLTVNYDDNNHGILANTHAIACAGTGYNLLNVGAIFDNNNPRSIKFVNAKAFGCGRNFDIGTINNEGDVFSEQGVDPDRFGAYSAGNHISVHETAEALNNWVDLGTGNVREGFDGFGNWNVYNSYHTKLSINARHEGYRELSQSGDRAFTDLFSGTTGDVTVTHGKNTASSRTDVFERVQFASSAAIPFTVFNSYSGYVDVTPGVIAAGDTYQSAIDGATANAGSGDTVFLTISNVNSFGGLDVTHYVHLGGSVVYRIRNASGGDIDPGTVRVRWDVIKHI